MTPAFVAVFTILFTWQAHADSAPPTNFIEKAVARKAEDHKASGKPADLAKSKSTMTLAEAKKDIEVLCAKDCLEACNVCVANASKGYTVQGLTSRGICNESNRCTQDTGSKKKAIREVWEASCLGQDGGRYAQIPSAWNETILSSAVAGALQKDGTERKFQKERWEQLRAVCSSLFNVDSHFAFFQQQVPCVKEELEKQYEKKGLVHDHNGGEFSPSLTVASSKPMCATQMGNFAMRLVYSTWHGPKMNNGGYCNSFSGAEKQTCQQILADAVNIRKGEAPGSGTGQTR